MFGWNTAIILISAALFLALILNLAVKPKVTVRLNGVLIFLAAVGGIVLYGSGFNAVLDDKLQAVVRTLFDVSRMFAGVNDYSAISSAPILQVPGMITVFWLVHFMAFYAMASATISVLGEKALKKLKYWLQRYGASVVIYGLNEESLELGQSLIKDGAKHLAYVCEHPDNSLEKAAVSAGALVRSDLSALEPNRSFLRSLGSEKGSPVLTLYAMGEDAEANTAYAEKLLAALMCSRADTSRVSLILRGTDDSVETSLQKSTEHDGYAEVRCFSDTSLASRMLMQAMPPYRKMEFDIDGRAVGDFDAVIIGFGRTGRSIIRQLACSAQFEGSHFRAAVFSPNIEKENGYFVMAYPGLVAGQDIRFIEKDAKSTDYYQYLTACSASLRYVAVCTGDPEKDAEIFSETSRYLRQIHCDAAICRCHTQAVSYIETPGAPVQSCRVFTAAAFSGAADRMAKILNHSYVNDASISVERAWDACDYFGRESSRASADFSGTFLKITGKTAREVADGAWETLTEVQKENLARTEHLRWWAFYEAMGFTPMSDSTVRERGEVYRREMAENGRSSLRITKDMRERRHACMRDYDALPALSALEEAYTGRYVNYQDMDIRNVLSLPGLIENML